PAGDVEAGEPGRVGPAGDGGERLTAHGLEEREGDQSAEAPERGAAADRGDSRVPDRLHRSAPRHHHRRRRHFSATVSNILDAPALSVVTHPGTASTARTPSSGRATYTRRA